jgi:Na+-transporting NADH:ubiquinone oxidoreductase subunit C
VGEQMKTIGFAAAVCLVCSLLLSVVYSTLREEQEANKANEIKVKVLSVLGLEVVDQKGRQIKTNEEIVEMFTSQIEGMVLDGNGKMVEDVSMGTLTSADINERDKETGLKKYYPLYVYNDSATGKKKYAIHMSGMGLWSVVKAYMAMNSDLETISGMVFYDHAETPGLGGEIEKEFFQSQFEGKKMYREGELQEFDIIKPGLETDDFCISGITAATMTCKGVKAFINKDFKVYSKYFATIRN